MAYSKVLEKLKIENAPYVRCTIIGDQNRLGHGSFFEKKLRDDLFILGGEETWLYSQDDKNFFNVAAFAEKILQREVGGVQKPIKTFDTLIAEVLSALRFNSLSVEDNFHNVLEGEILRDPDFQNASRAYRELDAKGSFADTLSNTRVDGFGEVVRYGIYGQVRNQIEADERELGSVNCKLSGRERSNLIEQIKSNRNLAIQMQEAFKREASAIVNPQADYLKRIKTRGTELIQIMRDSEDGSSAFNRAETEFWKIINGNKELLANDKKYKKAVEELKVLEAEKNQGSQGSQKW